MSSGGAISANFQLTVATADGYDLQGNTNRLGSVRKDCLNRRLGD